MNFFIVFPFFSDTFGEYVTFYTLEKYVPDSIKISVTINAVKIRKNN